MAPHARRLRPQRDDETIMAAVDDAGDEPRLVIADVARDDAWLSTATESAASLPDWQ